MSNELAANVQIVQDVKGYMDENNMAFISAEDAARGLGFTQSKNGVEYVRWETINRYLEDFGFSQLVGKDDFIPETMFYRLAMKANNETANAFQEKVATEVLPSIRKHGAYLTTATLEKVMTDPDFLIGIVTALKEEQQARKRLEAEKVVNTPKVQGYETLMSSEGTLSIGDFAKTIKHDPPIGRTTMFNFLVDMDVLQSKSGKPPYQNHRDAKRFEVIAVPKSGFLGDETRIFEQTRITPKGMDYVRKLVEKRFDSWRKARTKGMN